MPYRIRLRGNTASFHMRIHYKPVLNLQLCKRVFRNFTRLLCWEIIKNLTVVYHERFLCALFFPHSHARRRALPTTDCLNIPPLGNENAWYSVFFLNHFCFFFLSFFH